VERSHWWREVLGLGALYGLYTLVRDLRGDRPVSAHYAFVNAQRVMRVERWMGLFHERTIQDAVLSQRWLVDLCDDYYGSFHFVVTGGVLLLLYFRYPHRYRQWRLALATATAVALVGYYVFPLMPPRLLPPGYGFVDTLQRFGGFVTFSSGPVVEVANQYAAMPSLHTAWSLWCACALAAVLRPMWARVAVFAYPAFTVFTIVATANHYFLDAIAGALLALICIAAARPAARTLHRWSRRPPAGGEVEVDLPRPAPEPVR
jgi:membrane-associated phospholipid phosphatase